ncbi:MAG TPA: pseudouridine synthase [Polyangiales bacterium]|nr:pseudouridine synthase [Polyangiales bacterium]
MSDSFPTASSPCVHERCGGCTLLKLTAAEQLVRKRGHVTTATARYPELAASTIGPLTAAPAAETFAYRTRAKLVVSERGEIGLYAPGSHEVVDIPECLVMAPKLKHVVGAVRAAVRAQMVAGLSGIDLREVRHGAGGVLLTLLGDERERAALTVFAEAMAKVEHVIGVALSRRGARSPQLLGDAPVRISGVALAKDTLASDAPYFYATYGAFVQAHRAQASAVMESVQRELQAALGALKGARVLELYAGSGALGLSLAQQGAQCVLVERYEPALALVERAAQEQKLRGLATRGGDAEAVLVDLVHQRQRFDAVIVNPPRRGLSPQVRARIALLSPRVVVYISCDPETLSRDLADFARIGLASRTLAPFDMMPQSDDVECVVTLAPAPPAPIRILYQDETLIAVDKPPHLPTIPETEHASSLLERVRAQLGVPELFAVHRLDAGTSGVCLFVTKSGDVAPYVAALAAGQKHYSALVRGISHDKGIIKAPLRDGHVTREATTRYTRKAVVGGHSLLKVRPEQGRKHQVRRHLASIGRPVLGDARYGDPASNRHFEHRHGLDRGFLHLLRVELVLEGSAEPLVLEAPLAGDLQSVLTRLASEPA